MEEKYIDMAVNNAVSPVTGLVLAFPFPSFGTGQSQRTGRQFVVRRLQADLEFYYDEAANNDDFRILRTVLFRDNQHRGVSFAAGFMTHVKDGVMDPWDNVVNPLNWVYSERKLCNELRHDVFIDETVSLVPKVGTSAGFRYTRYSWTCNVWDDQLISQSSVNLNGFQGPWYGLAITTDVALFGINVTGSMRLRYIDM